jgi:hypothetical protein
MSEPETVMVRLADATPTSAGYSQPGDVVQLPEDEARALVRQALAEEVTE